MCGGFRLRCPASREKIDNRFESAGDSDFAEDVLKVCFDGIARETELVRHLLVRLAEDQQIDDLLFPLSQVQPREVRGGQRQGRRLTSTQTGQEDRKSTRLNSSHRCISYAVFCLKKKNKTR